MFCQTALHCVNSVLSSNNYMRVKILKFPSKTFSCRLQDNVLSLIKQLASDSGKSQSAIITSAIQMLADVKNNESGKNDNVKQIVNYEILEEFRRQLQEKDELIRNQTSQINSLIRQNDQSQQLIGAFSRIGEGTKLLEHGKHKMKKPKKEKEADILPKEEIKASKKKGKKSSSKLKKKKK